MKKILLKIFLFAIGFFVIYQVSNGFYNWSNTISNLRLFNIPKVEAKYTYHGACTPYIVTSATIQKPSYLAQVESGTVEGPATYNNGAYYNSSNQVVMRINATLERQGNTGGTPCYGNLDSTRGFTVSPTSLSVGSNTTITVSWQYCINSGYGCPLQTATETIGPFYVQAASQPTSTPTATPTPTPTATLPPVTVDIKANGSDGPISIPYNSEATLSWTSTNAEFCFLHSNNQVNGNGSNIPSSTFPPNGTLNTGKLISSLTYTIQCGRGAGIAVGSPGYGIYDSVTVNVLPFPPPGAMTLSVGATCNANNPGTFLSWTGASYTTGYFIYRNDNTNPIASVDATTTSYTDSNNLFEEEQYVYYVKAYNTSGTTNSNIQTVITKNCSGYTFTVSPSCTNSSPNKAKVDLSWVVKDKPDLFILYRNKGTTASTANPIKTLLNSDLSYIDLDVDKNTDYAYLLRAYYNNGVKDKTKVIKTEVCPEIPVVKKPTVDLKANDSDGPITVPYNTSAILTWTSTNATSCEAQGSWSGNKVLDSSLLTAKGESTGNLTTEKVYALVCIGADGQNSDSVIVKVGVQQTTPQTVIEFDSNIIKYPPPGFGDLIAPNWAEKVP